MRIKYGGGGGSQPVITELPMGGRGSATLGSTGWAGRSRQGRPPRVPTPQPAPDGLGPAPESHMGLSLVGGECEGREAWEIALLQDVTTSSHSPVPKHESPPRSSARKFGFQKLESPVRAFLGVAATPWSLPHHLGSSPALLAEPPPPGRAGEAAVLPQSH